MLLNSSDRDSAMLTAMLTNSVANHLLNFQFSCVPCFDFWYRLAHMSLENQNTTRTVYCTKKHISISKKIALEYDFSCTIRNDGITFPEKKRLFYRRKIKYNLSQKINGNDKILPFGQKSTDALFLEKYT